MYKQSILVFIVAEEEARRFRFYMDEPAYTDLHWVASISTSFFFFVRPSICFFRC